MEAKPYTNDEIDAMKRYHAEHAECDAEGFDGIGACSVVDVNGTYSRTLATIDAFTARIARLEAALRFYAEPSGYLPGTRAVSVVSMDGGMRARAALEAKP